MPGRQSTGPVTQKKPKKKQKGQKRYLNAFAIAEKTVPQSYKLSKQREGELDDEFDGKRKRDDYDSGSEEDDGPGPQKKARRGRSDENFERGSDSEGNEWTVGHVDSENDSDLDSDEAFGESDEERYEGFTFRGSSGTKKGKPRERAKDPEDEEIDLDEGNAAYEEDSGDESEGFAAEAMDLADVLDRRDSESEGEMEDDEESSSEDDERSELAMSDDDEDGQDPIKLSALRDMVTSLGNGEDEKMLRARNFDLAQEAIEPSAHGINPKQKLTIADVMPTVTDPEMRKSLRSLMNAESKTSKSSSGIPGKLEAPLPQRQLDKLDRTAATEKAKETLDRWIDTVKHNRRADHLQFPLPDLDAASAKNTSRLQASSSVPMSTLESTIQQILVASDLAPRNGKSQEDQLMEAESLAANRLPIEEVRARSDELRRQRELLFREEIKSKRVKKIKSKAYRRVHRRAREREAERERTALEEAGLIDEEAEAERLHRIRAEARMGKKHKESRWAKAMADSGRKAWDEDAREEMKEMAKREEDLKRRIQGRDVREDDSSLGEDESSDDEHSDENDEDFAERMRGKLDKLDGTQEFSRLSSLGFMQKAEAARKARNEEDIERLRKDLNGGDDHSDEEDDEEEQISGRRKYGPKQDDAPAKKPQENRGEFEEREDSDQGFTFADDAEENEQPVSLKRGAKANKLQNGISKQRLSVTNGHQQNQEDEDVEGYNPWTEGTKQHRKTVKPVDGGVTVSSRKDESTGFDQQEESFTLPEATSKSKPKLQSLQAADDSETSSSGTSSSGSNPGSDSDSDSDSDADSASSRSSAANPLATNLALLHRAFAPDETLAESTFAAEKAALAAAEEEEAAPASGAADALPGWGAWTGAGLSKRERRAQKAKPAASSAAAAGGKGKPSAAAAKRRDAGKARVSVSERRVGKNARYLAGQLPHPFESRAQYERSLRVPVGPEWGTAETFGEGTKPRVLLRPGAVVAPIRKPML